MYQHSLDDELISLDSVQRRLGFLYKHREIVANTDMENTAFREWREAKLRRLASREAKLLRKAYELRLEASGAT